MKATIKLLEKQHDALVQVIHWLDSHSDKEGRHSDKPIREVVDHILNHERDLEKDSEMELEDSQNKGRCLLARGGDGVEQWARFRHFFGA